MSDEAYLVVFDADNIAGYVFDSGRLKEIRGGSRLIRQNTREQKIVELAQGCDPGATVIYANGGAGVVRVTSCAAGQQLVSALQRDYRQATVGGSLTAVSVRYADSFATTLTQAQWALRTQKSAAPQRDHQYALGPYTAICVSCGRRPVQSSYQTAGERIEGLCATCLARRRADDDQHQAATETRGRGQDRERRVTLNENAGAGDRLAEMFLAQAHPGWVDAWLPNQLEELGQQATPRNYLGFLHADGNRMGEHLRAFAAAGQQLSDAEQEKRYGQFSRAIDAATATALAAALGKAFPAPAKTRGEFYAPFDNVLLAGDDAILVVAAHKALDVAVDFCQEFEQRMGQAARELDYAAQFTLAVGVVLANVKQPILYLQSQAKELLRRAKRLSGKVWAQQQAVSSVDFSVVTTPVLRPLGVVRREDYRLEEANVVLELTQRPYTAGDLAELLRLGRKLKGLIATAAAPPDRERRAYPRHQLNALYEAIFQGYTAAALQGARASLRVNPYQRQLLQEFAARFQSNDPLPWGATAARATAFADLVEIYDFLRDGGSEAVAEGAAGGKEAGHG